VTSAVVVAAGKGSRMGGGPDKVFLNLGPKPVLAHALAAFENCPDVDEIVVVVRSDQIPAVQGLVQMFGCRKVRRVVSGGKSRLDSVRNGVAACDPDSLYISVHDGARPCVTPQLVSDTVASAKKHGTGVAATKIVDTVKSASRVGVVEKTVDREPLWTVQTPQTFRASLLRKALAAADSKDPSLTDEAAVVEAAGAEVRLVRSSLPNIKITVPDDLVPAARLLGIATV